MRVRRKFVADYNMYDEAYQNCKAWCQDVAARLNQCASTEGERSVIESRLTRLIELLELSDSGSQRIQRVKECASHVLLSSSPMGSEAVNSSILELISFWDSTTNTMTSAKEQLEAALRERGERDALLMHLEKDLHSVEDEMLQLDSPQSTLPEKVAQLKRTKVCQIHLLLLSLSLVAVLKLLLYRLMYRVLPVTQIVHGHLWYLVLQLHRWYIIIRGIHRWYRYAQRYRNSVKNSHAYPGADADTDHNLVIMTAFLTSKNVKCKKQKRNSNVNKNTRKHDAEQFIINNIKRWDKENINTKGTDFAETIDEQMIKGNSSMTTDKRWKNLKSVMTTQAKRIIGYTKGVPAKKPWVTREMIEKMAQRIRTFKHQCDEHSEKEYQRLYILN